MIKKIDNNVIINGKISIELEQLSKINFHTGSFTVWEDVPFVNGEFSNNAALSSRIQLQDKHQWIQEQAKFECQADLLPDLSTEFFERIQSENHLQRLMQLLYENEEKVLVGWLSKVFETEMDSVLGTTFPELKRVITELKRNYTFTLQPRRIRSDDDTIIYEHALLNTLFKYHPLVSVHARLGLLYVHEKDYQKAQNMFENVFHNVQNLDVKAIVAVILGLLYRINSRLEQAMVSFRFALQSNRLLDPLNRTKLMESVTSGVYYWLALVCEELQQLDPAILCYQHCLQFMVNSAITTHPFVNKAVIYMRLGCYTLAFNTYGNKQQMSSLYIEPSPFRIDYQQAALAVRIAKYYYMIHNYQDCEKYAKLAEKRLRKLRYIERQAEDSEYAITDNLIQVNSLLAITYCQLGQMSQANKYAHVDKSRNSFLARAIISISKGDRSEFLAICEEMLSKDNEHYLSTMPIIIWQKLISQLIAVNSYKLSQLMTSKLLIYFNEYYLGWYVLFLLSLVCKDAEFTKGSFQKLTQLAPNTSLIKFWKYVFEDEDIILPSKL